MRTAAKRDENERPIIEALQAIGCLVIQETNIDLYVIYRGDVYPMEVKMPTGRLTPYQKQLHLNAWDNHGFEIPIVYTIKDAYEVIGYTNDRA